MASPPPVNVHRKSLTRNPLTVWRRLFDDNINSLVNSDDRNHAGVGIHNGFNKGDKSDTLSSKRVVLQASLNVNESDFLRSRMGVSGKSTTDPSERCPGISDEGCVHELQYQSKIKSLKVFEDVKPTPNDNVDVMVSDLTGNTNQILGMCIGEGILSSNKNRIQESKNVLGIHVGGIEGQTRQQNDELQIVVKLNRTEQNLSIKHVFCFSMTDVHGFKMIVTLEDIDRLWKSFHQTKTTGHSLRCAGKANSEAESKKRLIVHKDGHEANLLVTCSTRENVTANTTVTNNSNETVSTAHTGFISTTNQISPSLYGRVTINVNNRVTNDNGRVTDDNGRVTDDNGRVTDVINSVESQKSTRDLNVKSVQSKIMRYNQSVSKVDYFPLIIKHNENKKVPTLSSASPSKTLTRNPLTVWKRFFDDNINSMMENEHRKTIGHGPKVPKVQKVPKVPSVPSVPRIRAYKETAESGKRYQNKCRKEVSIHVHGRGQGLQGDDIVCLHGNQGTPMSKFKKGIKNKLEICDSELSQIPHTDSQVLTAFNIKEHRLFVNYIPGCSDVKHSNKRMPKTNRLLNRLEPFNDYWMEVNRRSKFTHMVGDTVNTSCDQVSLPNNRQTRPNRHIVSTSLTKRHHADTSGDGDHLGDSRHVKSIQALEISSSQETSTLAQGSFDTNASGDFSLLGKQQRDECSFEEHNFDRGDIRHLGFTGSDLQEDSEKRTSKFRENDFTHNTTERITTIETKISDNWQEENGIDSSLQEKQNKTSKAFSFSNDKINQGLPNRFNEDSTVAYQNEIQNYSLLSSVFNLTNDRTPERHNQERIAKIQDPSQLFSNIKNGKLHSKNSSRPDSVKGITKQQLKRPCDDKHVLDPCYRQDYGIVSDQRRLKMKVDIPETILSMDSEKDSEEIEMKKDPHGKSSLPEKYTKHSPRINPFNKSTTEDAITSNPILSFSTNQVGNNPTLSTYFRHNKGKQDTELPACQTESLKVGPGSSTSGQEDDLGGDCNPNVGEKKGVAETSLEINSEKHSTEILNHNIIFSQECNSLQGDKRNENTTRINPFNKITFEDKVNSIPDLTFSTKHTLNCMTSGDYYRYHKDDADCKLRLCLSNTVKPLEIETKKVQPIKNNILRNDDIRNDFTLTVSDGNQQLTPGKKNDILEAAETFQQTTTRNELNQEPICLSFDDLSQSSIECLLEQLVQRGKIKTAFVMDLQGEVLARSNKHASTLSNHTAKCFYDSLRGHYNGLMKIDAGEGNIYTGFKSADGSMFLGTNKENVTVCKRGASTIVVGFARKDASGSCIKEMAELTDVLDKRRP